MGVDEKVIEKENLLRIILAYGVGTVKGFNLFKKLASTCLVSVNFKEMIKDERLTEEEKNKLLSVDEDRIYDILDGCYENHIEIITIFDPRFPRKLINIDIPPLIIYVKGEICFSDRFPCVCVVGPRKISDFGKKAAYSIGYRLARAGITVISGGAVGGDAAALKGAIKAQGNCVSVLPGGILSDYIAENRTLRNKVLENGCLISEFPPFASPPKYAFKLRNRLLSALSNSVCIVEAGEKSGTLITANYAAQQGRDLLVIPGNPSSPFYKGSNQLLRDGAIPLIDTSDIFVTLLPKYAERIDIDRAFTKPSENQKEKVSKKTILTLSKEAQVLYNNMDKQIFSTDDLLSFGLSTDSILSALTELELNLLIKPLPGGKYKMIK